jgi:hypothetical protein
MIQSVLPLHECAPESVADPATTEFVANPAAEPIHSVADPAATGAALTKTSCLCVHV